MRRQDPVLAPFGSGLVLIDGPLLIGLAASGDLATVDVWFDGRLRVSQNTPAEIRDAWANGVPGADLDTDAQVVAVADAGDDVATQTALGRQWRTLADMWRQGSMSEGRARGLATSFVTAKHRNIPLLTHHEQAWVAAAPSSGVPRRVQIGGIVEVALVGVKAAAIDPASAWELYSRVASTAAGFQPEWKMARRGDFLGWAGEAAAGRL